MTYDELYSRLLNLLHTIRIEKENLESQAKYEATKIENLKNSLNERDAAPYIEEMKKKYEELQKDLIKKQEEYKKYLDEKASRQFNQDYEHEIEKFNMWQSSLSHKQRELAIKEIHLKTEQEEIGIKQKFWEDVSNKIHTEIEQLAAERQIGFPLLAKAIVELEKLKDEELVFYLRRKKHPAYQSAEIVQEETRKRRIAEYKCKVTEEILAFYEKTFPYLLDYKEVLPIPTKEELSNYAEYTEKEKEDESTLYLSPEEYRSLSTIERNQRALDRYKRRVLSKKEIGNMYERYIGYLYEKEGYDVSYVGILKGLEDMGRDLICKKGNDIKIIQCKNWAQYKDIFENSIFQFFGTVFKYKYDMLDIDRKQSEPAPYMVDGLFYTTTSLSPFAKEVADFLHITIKDNFKLDKDYPCIKCNIASSGEKIYHFPFDQQYDRAKIIYEKGEFYCKTVAEAEARGFRRAMRYHYLENKI